MTDRELKKLLKNIKHEPAFGGDFDDAAKEAHWIRVADELGFDSAADNVSYTWKEQFDFWVGKRFLRVVRPAAMGMATLVLVLGGWMTTASAFESLPGDILYPVKMATERVQIKLASPERRAKLHVEFAGRRLQEMSQLAESNRPDRQERMRESVQNFSRALASASDDLEEVRSSEPDQVAEVASAIDRKTEEFASLLENSQDTTPEENKQDVEDAKQAVDDNEDQVVDTLVESHEQTKETRTADSLQEEFQDQYRDLQTRITLLIGRMEVAENAIEDVPEERQAVYLAQIEQMRSDLKTTTYEEQFGDAMDLLAAGGYRAAFDGLRRVELSVEPIEASMIALEIELSTPTPDSESDETDTQDTSADDDDGSQDQTQEDEGSNEDGETDESSGATF